MKTIGLIGGMSWESTATYYQLLNRLVRERLGGLHSAKLLLWSFDFAEIEAYQADGDWDAATRAMVAAAQALERGGAEMILICTNTMHKMADEVQAAISVPLLHIADVTAEALLKAGRRKPLLLATAYTMEQEFYTSRLKARGLEVMISSAPDRACVHGVIYDELCKGIIEPASRAQWNAIVDRAAAAGADSVIFGCTEVGLLLRPEELPLPCFDTTEIHAVAALDRALA
ncbi:aspartate/glutamate racemase family protein [Aliiruegeria sabulilitoris]|uniref:aspartate/glutamate racemase family protein n=1 Tax=Aliiruegeria sabulilitoris TaxID=1510458 RepID=UPI0008349BAF|nr:aspartate/glutamate racemase family protein [Aliiruegeria sabulilitoris]NDR56292.1 aspartate/glutamate racemase family protein [Pseudoruegeria sp. M32A2M]